MRRRTFLLSGIALFGASDARLAGIPFQVVKNGRGPRRYFWPHGNETTARDVLLAHLKVAQGTAYLTRSDVRAVRTEGLELDPNRMFSRAGAERSLRRLNPHVPEATIANALLRLDNDRPKFLRGLLPPPGGLLIALHNNSEGYSIQDEIPISDQSHVPRRSEPHEFFLCTGPADYALLAQGPYNVALQQTGQGPDDGSLSRLCAREHIRYVNLEVALGKAAIQTEMLAWLERTLPEVK
jgi:hypothetical protein